jgi:hypothetical protein
MPDRGHNYAGIALIYPKINVYRIKLIMNKFVFLFNLLLPNKYKVRKIKVFIEL